MSGVWNIGMELNPCAECLCFVLAAYSLLTRSMDVVLWAFLSEKPFRRNIRHFHIHMENLPWAKSLAVKSKGNLLKHNIAITPMLLSLYAWPCPILLDGHNMWVQHCRSDDAILIEYYHSRLSYRPQVLGSSSNLDDSHHCCRCRNLGPRCQYCCFCHPRR